MPRPHAGRHGTTLLEQLLVLSVVALLLGVAVPVASARLDRLATRGAIRDATDLFLAARDLAVAQGAAVAVHLPRGSGRLLVVAGRDTVLARPLGTVHGVTLLASRDSMAYGGHGLGRGASNLRLVARRGRAADTLTVSRLGRVSR